MSDLYVVIGENGEWSDRMTFVCGVYHSLETAQAAIVARSAVRRTYDEWHNRFCENVYRVKGGFLNGITTDEQKVKAVEMTGHEPEYESAERLSVHVVTPDEWNSRGWAEVTMTTPTPPPSDTPAPARP